jgi:pyrroline-5-carboxylate reductase
MTLRIDGTLLLAGAGNMGSAMLSGWLDRGLDPKQMIVQDPSPPERARELIKRHGIDLRASVGPLREAPAVLVVAVKPQVMDQVFPPLAQLAGPGTVVLSVAAGRRIEGFERHLSKGASVVRCIPNTPSSIGRGITAAVGNAHVTPAQRATCDALLRAIGEVVWLEEEGLIDAVTAVSGSGPAYVFYLAECLSEAGVQAGALDGIGCGRAAASLRSAGRRAAPERDLPQRHHVRSPTGADGRRRSCQDHARGGGRGYETVAGTRPVAERLQ